MNARQPNLTFFLVGAARSGTTSLQQYIRQHPDAFLPAVKSRHFAIKHLEGMWAGPGDGELRRNSATTASEFAALYHEYAGETQVGDAAGLYLYTAGVAEELADRYSEARIVAILRNPVERAFSAYNIMRRRGLEPIETFADALDVEADRIASGWSFAWHYTRAGRYGEQLARYFSAFPREQILVLKYDDLQRDPLATTQHVYRFLGLDPGFGPDTRTIHNPSGASRIPALDRIVLHPGVVRKIARRMLPRRVRQAVARSRALTSAVSTNLRKPELSQMDRKTLSEVFRRDIESAQQLSRLDLSGWLR